MTDPPLEQILRLAEIIHEVDGAHDKGAAALAEAILSHPNSLWHLMNHPPPSSLRVAMALPWGRPLVAVVEDALMSSIKECGSMSSAAILAVADWLSRNPDCKWEVDEVGDVVEMLRREVETGVFEAEDDE